MLSANAVSVLEKRYLAHNNQFNRLETPPEMFRRVAGVLASADYQYGHSIAAVERTTEDFYALIYGLDFLPNSPTLANAGARTGQLSACFVVPVPDNLNDIFNAIRVAALTHQTGGGTGFSFSRLRPASDSVAGNQGVSSGPTSFMDVFNAATESIKQGGMRRGANMGILRIDHPDIMAFITHKEDLSKLTNFNISVAVTDAFMQAVEAGTDYALINPRTGTEWGRLDAREVFKTVVLKAWHTGEPGIVFIDRMNRYCPVPWLGEYEATNPCGEQPLLPYESCNLGSINLERFVEYDEQGQPFINWKRLRRAVHTSTRLMDNVIDKNVFPVPEYKLMSDATRKLGIGVMGFARMLFKLSIGYGSLESCKLAGRVMSFIDFESKMASVELAKERGVFPALIGHEEEFQVYFDRLCVERQKHPYRHPDCDYRALAQLVRQYGIRNSNTTTVAPTGTLSIIADTSGGCEPVFAIAFKRWQADMHMIDVDHVFVEYAKANDFYSEELMAAIDANHGSLVGLKGFALPDAALDIFKTAHDVTPRQHVYIQAAFQAFNDSATSKTINFAESATTEDVHEAYMLAWATGCKGITVYRNNSRKFQPLSVAGAAQPSSPGSLGKTIEVTIAHATACPECKTGELRFEEGCEKCVSCGYSACSYQPPVAPPPDK